ncbi:MAG: T9SS type A sorting domain-containing protein [Ignavibacteriaceae bacterium]
MTGEKFASFIFIIIIASFYSYAQTNDKKEAAEKKHFDNNTPVSLIKPVQKNSSSEKISTDTLHSSFIKQDFIVNNFEGEFGADQNNASAAIDSAGNYAVVWQDYRNGKPDIYVQFFNSNDEKIDSNIKVNQQDSGSYYPPSIAVNNKGDFVIVWGRSENEIGIRKFTINGEKVENVFGVNFPASYFYSQPSVAVNDNGSFLVCWNGNYVLAELFDKTGYPVLPETFGEPGSSNYGAVKNVDTDSKGNFYIVWSAYGNDNRSNIYLQVIDSLGEKVNNIIVSDTSDKSYKNTPQIASNNNGYLLIAWNYYSNNNNSYVSGEKISILRSDGHFTAKGLEIINNPDKIVSDRDSTFYISYPYYNSQGIQQHLIQKVNINGNFSGEPLAVKFNSTKDFLTNRADLTNIVNAHFIIVPEIYERSDANIYIQKFNTDIKAAGAFIKVNDDTGSAFQQLPLVKFNDKGESIVLWRDKRNGRFDLYGQVYDKNFNTAGNNVMINETDSEIWNLTDKKVRCLSDGTFVVAFSGYSGSDTAWVFLRLIKGEKAGENVSVKKNTFYEPDLHVALNINSKDEVLICWYNNKVAYIRKYDKELNPLSYEKRIIQNNYPGSDNFNIYAVSIDTGLNILAIGSIPGSGSQIAGKFFSVTGEETSDFLIPTSGNSNYANIKCINENGNYAIVFNDYTEIHIIRSYHLEKEYYLDNEIRPQNNWYDYNLNLVEFKNQKLLFTYDANPHVTAVFLNDNKREIKICQLHTYPDVDAYDQNKEYLGANSAGFYNNKLFFAYEKMNSGTGYDIQGNVQQIDSINFTKEPFITMQVNDALNYNYPNPFNSITRITYTIAAYHKVKLTVYDILGREVRILVDNYQEKGNYEVDFDASGLASGIYFYRLEAFNTIVRKLILLK